MSRMDDYNYHRDPRTWDVPSLYTVTKSGPHTSEVELDECVLESLIDQEILPDTHNGILEVSTKFEVCDQCQGSGSMVDPRIDAGGLSEEDLYEDPEFAEDYFGGRYDVSCNRCKGKRVVPSLTFPDAIQKLLEEWQQDMWDSAAEMAAERAMGA